jgi:hypothetical protein
MRLSLFCNACQKSDASQDEGMGWFAHGEPPASNVVMSASIREQAPDRLVRCFSETAQRVSSDALADPNSRPPPPRKAPVPKAPWEVLLRRKHLLVQVP